MAVIIRMKSMEQRIEWSVMRLFCFLTASDNLLTPGMCALWMTIAEFGYPGHSFLQKRGGIPASYGGEVGGKEKKRLLGISEAYKKNRK